MPAGGGTFLFRQESTQRSRHRGGAEPQLPLAKRPSPMYPTGRITDSAVQGFGLGVWMQGGAADILSIKNGVPKHAVF